MGAQDLNADRLFFVVQDHLDFADGFSFSQAAVIVLEFFRPNLIVDAGFPGTFFIHADAAQGRIGVGAPGQESVVNLARKTKDGIADHDAALIPGSMGKLKTAVDIAGGINVLDVGSETVVDEYSLAIELYANILQPEIVGVGSPSQGDQDRFRLQASDAALARF